MCRACAGGAFLGIGGGSGVEVHRLPLAVTVCAMIGVGGGVAYQLASLRCSGNSCSCVTGCSAAGRVLVVTVVIRWLKNRMIGCRVYSIVGVVAWLLSVSVHGASSWHRKPSSLGSALAGIYLS